MSQAQDDSLAAAVASVDLDLNDGDNAGDGPVNNIEATVNVNGTATPANTIDADEEEEYGEIVNDLPPPEVKKKKKKKNRKPPSKRGLVRF